MAERRIEYSDVYHTLLSCFVENMCGNQRASHHDDCLEYHEHFIQRKQDKIKKRLDDFVDIVSEEDREDNQPPLHLRHLLDEQTACVRDTDELQKSDATLSELPDSLNAENNYPHNYFVKERNIDQPRVYFTNLVGAQNNSLCDVRDVENLDPSMVEPATNTLETENIHFQKNNYTAPDNPSGDKQESINWDRLCVRQMPSDQSIGSETVDTLVMNNQTTPKGRISLLKKEPTANMEPEQVDVTQGIDDDWEDTKISLENKAEFTKKSAETDIDKIKEGKDWQDTKIHIDNKAELIMRCQFQHSLLNFKKPSNFEKVDKVVGEQQCMEEIHDDESLTSNEYAEQQDSSKRSARNVDDKQVNDYEEIINHQGKSPLSHVAATSEMKDQERRDNVSVKRTETSAKSRTQRKTSRSPTPAEKEKINAAAKVRTRLRQKHQQQGGSGGDGDENCRVLTVRESQVMNDAGGGGTTTEEVRRVVIEKKVYIEKKSYVSKRSSSSKNKQVTVTERLVPKKKEKTSLFRTSSKRKVK